MASIALMSVVAIGVLLSVWLGPVWAALSPAGMIHAGRRV
jgi:hypothetical protein